MQKVNCGPIASSMTMIVCQPHATNNFITPILVNKFASNNEESYVEILMFYKKIMKSLMIWN